jgi:hypothetical protein
MAITTETFKVNVGWAKSDIILQMESALTSLGWHGGTQTGQVIGLGTFWGGGIVNTTVAYHDVFQKSTSGIGTGASFYIYRDTVGIRYINVNRLGVGYTSGELITISSEDIGGLANGATDLNFKVCVNETVANTTTVSVAITTWNTTNNAYTYLFTGTDRNGTVGGGQTVITIREGDILRVTNNFSNNYAPGLKTPEPYEGNTSYATIAGCGPLYVGVGATITFQSKIGQAGTYFFTNTQYNQFPEMGRLIIEPWNGNPADRTLVGVGTTAGFITKNVTSGATTPWGVTRHTIQANKRFGDTYKVFAAPDNQYIDIVTGNGWSSYAGTEYYGNALNVNTDTSDSHGGTAEKFRFAGAKHLDFGSYNIDSIRTAINLENSVYTSQYNRLARLNHGSNTGFELDLNLFKSSLDPNFVVFSYKAPTLSSTHVANNTFDTWFFHNFTTNLWNLDYVFLGGLTQIIYQGSTTDPKLVFRTYLAPNDPDNNWGMAKRAAEFGYASYTGFTDGENTYVEYTIESKAYDQTISTSSSRIYYRSNDNPVTYSGGSSDTTGKDRVSAEANFNAAIKGLPMNGNLIPVPYYIPDDFVIINFYYNAANANIQQGDTITISPSEVYKVICGSYNQTTYTRGILFCARVV